MLATLGAQFPRRLILDFVGEYIGKLPNARETFSLLETVDALRTARRRGDRWTVVACIDPADVGELVGGIAPVGRATDYGFARAVGGLVIECGEIELIAPNQGKIADEVKNLFGRGRHHSISILAAAVRAADVKRIVTSQADMLCAFRQHEPSDADYLGRLMRSDAPDIIKALPERHYLRYLVNYGRLETIDPGGNVAAVHTEETLSGAPG